MSILIKILSKFLNRAYDRLLFKSSFKLIQRLRLIEKKVNILYEVNSEFDNGSFATISELLNPHFSRFKEENFIRLGSKNDGGYVILNKVFKNNLLISMGIGHNLDFEQDWVNLGGKVVAFDGTIDTINSRILNKSTNSFKWIKQNINLEDDEKSIHINQAINSALDIYSPTNHSCILKLDIENSEWNALQEISDENLSKFDQIIVEFHELIRNTLLDYTRVNSVLLKLQNNFDLVWKHENNYSPYFKYRNTRFFDTVETTWHNKKSLKSVSPVKKSKMAKELNAPNDASYPNY